MRPVQLDGLVGIPNEFANEYWQAAFDAAEEIILSNKYSLYQSNPEKHANYAELFFAAESPENILSKRIPVSTENT